MSRPAARPAVRIAAGVATLALAAGAVAATPVAAVAATPASGSVVVNESNTFFQQAALAGIIALPLPSGTGSYDGTTGLSATFPVTGGVADIPQFYGNIELGGSLLVIDVKTGRSLVFKQLAFSVDSWQLTGVPAGATTPIALADPAGDARVTRTGTLQTLTSADLTIDAQAAQLLDQKLNTTFFAEGRSIGSLAVNFTPAS
ncbi:hypothetical protein AB0K43_20790 [Kitasatospora sp. NPDC049258]|uniref:hypothetical protein n=1 Tax=Kitasatospora sp. NPDC049258 TaxID=3155394 RepID=UPI00341B162E